MYDARRPVSSSSEGLRNQVIACRKCPRLVRFRESVLPRAAFAGQHYWRKPVPGFGDVNGRVLVLGLAPAAQGGNRTGRPFTGDSSGRFLVRALYETGFASAPVSESMDDGLSYRDCYLTAAVKCVPPGDKPTEKEFANCSVYLDEEIALMENLKAILALGSLAFGAYLGHLNRLGVSTRGIRFSHGERFEFGEAPSLYSSYHPSPRNTNTGRLTHRMLVSVLRRMRSDLKDGSRI
jgi:uracil-DNA glycosylase family 4